MEKNKLKHTPGPWIIGTQGTDGAVFIEAGFILAQTFAPSLEEAEDNAILISAAPDLLEACKSALNFLKPLDMEDGLTLKLLKAINKAEGR